MPCCTQACNRCARASRSTSWKPPCSPSQTTLCAARGCARSSVRSAKARPNASASPPPTPRRASSRSTKSRTAFACLPTRTPPQPMRKPMRKEKQQNSQRQPTATSTKFEDLECHRWWFFLLQHATSDGALVYALPDDFVKALNAAGAWLGWSKEKGELLSCDIRLGAFHLNLSRRLVKDEAAQRHNHDGTLCMLEARTLLDACYLQLCAVIKGALNLNSPRALQNSFPALNASEPDEDNKEEDKINHAFSALNARKPLLGTAECWCLMLAAGEPNEDALREAIQLLKQQPEQPQEGYLTFATQGGLLALYPDTLTCYLVYASAQTQPMSVLLHQLLPLLLLNLLKIRLLRGKYPPFKAQVVQHEAHLEQKMAHAREAHCLSIEQIERHSLELARQQAHYLEALSQIEEGLHTLKTLQDNLRRLLRDPLWYNGDESAPARRLFEPVQLLIDQLQSDLHYFHITRQQADLHLESLNTASVTRNTQWNRRTAIVLLVLALPTLLGSVAGFIPELTQKVPVSLRGIVAGMLFLVVGVLPAWSFSPLLLSLVSKQRTSPNTPTELPRLESKPLPTSFLSCAPAEPPKGVPANCPQEAKTSQHITNSE